MDFYRCVQFIKAFCGGVAVRWEGSGGAEGVAGWTWPGCVTGGKAENGCQTPWLGSHCACVGCGIGCGDGWVAGAGAGCGGAVAGEEGGMGSCGGKVYGKGTVGWRCGACGRGGGDF